MVLGWWMVIRVMDGINMMNEILGSWMMLRMMNMYY